MPSYRIKNLNISLPDELKARTDLVQYCTLGNTRPWPIGCCNYWSYNVCPVTTKPPTPPTDCWPFISKFDDLCGPPPSWVTAPPDPAGAVTQLDLLRKALQEAMQAVEERGVQLQKQARPQTLDEAEKLEKELTDALKELQAMKKQMK